MNKNVYEKYTEKKMKDAEDFCEGYKKYITNAKTEREAIIETVKLAEKNGFVNITKKKKLKAGDKIYAINMDKAMMLAVIGSEPMENGLNIVGSHIDSPRLDLKATPVYEDSELAYFYTH